MVQRTPAALPHASHAAPTARLARPTAGGVQLRAGDRLVDAFEVPAGLLDASAARPPGELPTAVRRKMEAFFEADLSDVRVHVGPEAGAIGALAFTLGSDIYFAPGQYDPHSERGQELLGHELTHVLQQREGRVGNPFGDRTAVVQDPALEDEADRMGRLVAPRGGLATTYRRELARGGIQPAARNTRGASAQRREASYRLVLGAYVHDDANLPEQLAGHAFVAIEDPRGERQAFGFSPARFSDYDPRRDLARLRAGVEGVVHSDGGAFEKPGVKLRSYPITEAQAKAALAKVEEYRSGRYDFSLDGAQCTAFAADVASAADVREAAALRGRLPRDVYRKL